MSKIRKELLKLTDEVVDDLMKVTDEEILSEALEDGLAIDKEVSMVRGILEKSRFNHAQKILKNHDNNTVYPSSSKGNIIDIEEAKRRIHRAYDENPSYLMAARFGEGVPDEDIMDVYRQMVKHGLIPEATNENG